MCKQSKSTLEGYVWVDFEDGSGHLEDNHGKRVANYDLFTHEYQIGNRGWEFCDEGLQTVKDLCEERISQLLKNNEPIIMEKSVYER